MKLEAEYFSESLGSVYETKCYCISEYDDLNIHCFGNLKSRLMQMERPRTVGVSV
jgi:hypothetical protein